MPREQRMAEATELKTDVSQIKILYQDGPTRLELWSEGLVLWYAGEMVWKSWKDFVTPKPSLPLKLFHFV